MYYIAWRKWRNLGDLDPLTLQNNGWCWDRVGGSVYVEYGVVFRWFWGLLQYYVFISNTHIGLIQILRRLDAKICLGVQREWICDFLSINTKLSLSIFNSIQCDLCLPSNANFATDKYGVSSMSWVRCLYCSLFVCIYSFLLPVWWIKMFKISWYTSTTSACQSNKSM